MPKYKERGSNLDKFLPPYLSIIYQKPIKKFHGIPPSTYKIGVKV